MSNMGLGSPPTGTAGLLALAALELVLADGASALTMANVANAAGVSRQTLYRHYPDLDAVLGGVAALVAAHDTDFAGAVAAQGGAGTQLEFFIRSVVAADHGGGPSVSGSSASGLIAALPPNAREALRNHERNTIDLLVSVLQRGVDTGEFRPDVQPTTDAALLLGLINAASPERLDRVLALARQLTAPNERNQS